MADGSNAELLRGQQVVFTGKLASMTRRQAVQLVRAHGGQWAASVTRGTSLLVIGQEGWPLREDGRLSNKLRHARLLQRRGHPLTVCTEEALLTRLGLEDASRGIAGLYSMPQLCRLVRVPRDRLRSWIKAGIVQPVKTEQGVDYFDFRQVSGAKTLCELTRTGVNTKRIQQSLHQLRRWLGEDRVPSVIEENGRLRVRLPEGQLAEPTGQLCFEFTEQANRPVLEATFDPVTAPQWYETGYEHESSGRLTEAAEAYRQALLLGGPDAGTCFNLANVLYALGQKAQALERFRQSIEIDRAFAEAWNNLGNLLAERKQHAEALAAYQNALGANPNYADAHYNLADLLEETGRRAEACAHWRAYLRHDPQSDWANYARGRLKASQ